jgi:hypothetical protein
MLDPELFITGKAQYSVAIHVDCPWQGSKQSAKCGAKKGERCSHENIFPQYPHSARFDLACNTLDSIPPPLFQQ